MYGLTPIPPKSCAYESREEGVALRPGKDEEKQSCTGAVRQGRSRECRAYANTHICETGECGREYVELEYVDVESVSLLGFLYRTKMRVWDSSCGFQRAHMNVAVGSS